MVLLNPEQQNLLKFYTFRQGKNLWNRNKNRSANSKKKLEQINVLRYQDLKMLLKRAKKGKVPCPLLNGEQRTYST